MGVEAISLKSRGTQLLDFDMLLFLREAVVTVELITTEAFGRLATHATSLILESLFDHLDRSIL